MHLAAPNQIIFPVGHFAGQGSVQISHTEAYLKVPRFWRATESFWLLWFQYGQMGNSSWWIRTKENAAQQQWCCTARDQSAQTSAALISTCFY